MRLALGFFSVLTCAVVVSGAARADQGVADAAIREAFSVSAWTVQSRELSREKDGLVTVEVVLDGTPYALSLYPYSLRSADFQLLVEEASGLLVEHEAPTPNTYRGTVDGVFGSEVAASVQGDQLTANVRLKDDDIWWFVQPLSDGISAAEAASHLVYKQSDTVAHDDWTCGLDDLNVELRALADVPGGPGSAAQSKQAEIAFDTDFEFFQRNQSSVPNSIADIERVANGMEIIYLRDVDVCFKISKIIIRSSSNDPYTRNDPEGLLQQFRSHWKSQQGGVVRDIAHLMTGRTPPGGVLGIAWLTVVCNRDFGYAVSWTKFTSNLSFRVGLTAHEVGHNFSAPHCNGKQNCWIMCSGLGGCSRNVTKFGPDSINRIKPYARSRNCMGECGPTVTCDDVKKIKGKCKRSGVIKGKVILFSKEFDGSILKVDVSGEEEEAEVKGKKAKFSSFFFDPGKHTIELIDPRGCDISKKVKCP